MPGFIRHATQAVGTDAGNGEVRKAQWNENHVLDGVPYVIAQSAVAVSAGAVTTEEVLATITVPAGAIGPNGQLQIHTVWTMTNGANNKITRARLGGIAGTAYLSLTHTTIATFFRSIFVNNVNSASSQKSTWIAGSAASNGTSASALTTSAVDTSAAFDIVLTGQKAVAGEVITLESYQVLVCYGA